MSRRAKPRRIATLILWFLFLGSYCLLFSTGTPICSGQITALSQKAAMAAVHRSYIASGGDRWKRFTELKVKGTLNLGGIEGTYEQMIDLRQGRDANRLDAGPVHIRQVTLTDASWQLDQSGIVSYADTPDAKADAVNASFIDRNGWFDVPPDEIRGFTTREEAGKDYGVVSILPAGGREMMFWFSAEDGLLYRIDQLDAAHHQNSIRLSDYHEVQGVLVPFVLRQYSGGAEPELAETIRSASFSAQLNQTPFQMPPSVFRDAALSGGRNEVEVPFRLADNRILINVSINGHAQLPFLLDTGGSNVLTPEAAKMLGLESGGNLPVAGVGSNAGNAHLSTVNTVRLGQVNLSNQPFLILPLPQFLQDRGSEPPIAGLLGAELLRRFPTTFNFQRKVLTFYKPGSVPPPLPGAHKSHLFMNSGHPFVELQVDGAAGVFGIDTGDSGSVTLFAAFYKQHLFPIEQPTQPKQQGGLGGTQVAQLTRVESVTLGTSEVKRPLVTLNTSSQGVFSNGELAGNLGYQFLHRFLFTLDYEHRAGYFLEASGLPASDSYNRSGMTLDRKETGEVYASEVNAGSPAQQAGIHVGDVIVSINNESAMTSARSSLNELLSRDAGTPVSILVLRDGIERPITFNLAELLPRNGPLTPLVEKSSALPLNIDSVTGTWICKGTFRGGRPHESTYAVSPVLNRTWLELTEHDTLPATGYDAKYLIGYDPDHRRLIEYDANTFGAATYTSVTGWTDGSLTMTSEPAPNTSLPYALNRFHYSVPAAGSLVIDWEISKYADTPVWITADHLMCSRAK